MPRVPQTEPHEKSYQPNALASVSHPRGGGRNPSIIDVRDEAISAERISIGFALPLVHGFNFGGHTHPTLPYTSILERLGTSLREYKTAANDIGK